MSVKTQDIRLVDVFLLGPFMVWAATRLQPPGLARLALAVAGVYTIAYNWRNYVRIRDGESEA